MRLASMSFILSCDLGLQSVPHFLAHEARLSKFAGRGETFGRGQQLSLTMLRSIALIRTCAE